MAKHTEGPWEVRANGMEVWADGNRIAQGYGAWTGAPGNAAGETPLANIALIAAAPELLEAARSLLLWVHQLHIGESFWSDEDGREVFYSEVDIVQNLNAAIAKAEGRRS